MGLKIRHIIFAALCASIALTPALAYADDGNDMQRGFEPGEILVVYEPTAGPFAASQATSKMGALGMPKSMNALSRFDVEDVETIDKTFAGKGNLAVVTLEDETQLDDALAALNASPQVAYAQRNFRYYLNDSIPAEDDSAPVLTTQADTGYSSLATQTNDPRTANQYYLNPWADVNGYGANVYEAWDYVKTEGDVTIAILDTGVRPTHEDLTDNILTDLMWDAFNQTEPGVIKDNSGHGTHVCGIASAVANNSVGIAGASYNAKLLPIKVFNDDRDAGEQHYAETEWILRAYNYMEGLINDGTLSNLHVINMSLGGYDVEEDDYVLEAAIEKMRDDYRIITVCSGGNGVAGEAETAPNYPSDFDASFAVTALNKKGNNTVWSDYNSHKDISAPGAGIYSTYNGSDVHYKNVDGTSMSSPLVAGIASLLWAAVPNLTVEEAVAAMTLTAHKLNPNAAQYHADTGSAGAIDAAAAVQYAIEHFADNGRIDISGADIETVEWVFYTGKPNTPSATVKLNGTTLVEGRDFKLEYIKNTEVGAAQVVAVGMGDYKGTASKEFQILYDISDETFLITSRIAAREYTGQEITPPLTIRYNGVLLQEGTDYKLSYASNINGQVATITIEGIGKFRGSCKVTFEIIGSPIYKKLIDAEKAAGELLKTTPIVNAGASNPTSGNWVRKDVADALQKALDKAKLAYEKGVTQKEIDDEAALLNKAIKAFKDAILPTKLASASVATQTHTYTGKAIKPAVTVKDARGKTVPASACTITYANNTKAGTATVTVKAKAGSEYTGSVKATFKIVAAEQGVYWLVNKKTGENLYTTAVKEVNTLSKVKKTWINKGLMWYAPTVGEPIYRLFNPKTGDHHFTKSANEVRVLTKVKKTWKADFDGKPIFYSGGSKKIWRQYSESRWKANKPGTHKFTTYNAKLKGWKNEGALIDALRYGKVNGVK